MRRFRPSPTTVRSRISSARPAARSSSSRARRANSARRSLDGEFKTKCERLAASNNPNLLLMNYDLKSLAVVNLFIVPKHFFVREIIEERKPLAATARRAGWIGSKILLDRVPESGKIHIVQSGVIRPKELVLAEWQKTLFLRSESPETRGWLLDVMKCVESLASAISRSTRSTPSSGISAISIPATRTSNPRYASSFNICATADLSISCRVVIIACDPRACSSLRAKRRSNPSSLSARWIASLRSQ